MKHSQMTSHTDGGDSKGFAFLSQNVRGGEDSRPQYDVTILFFMGGQVALY